MCPASALSRRGCARSTGPQTLEQRAAFEEKLSLARRFILGIGVAVLATIGYLIGNAMFPIEILGGRRR